MQRTLALVLVLVVLLAGCSGGPVTTTAGPTTATPSSTSSHPTTGTPTSTTTVEHTRHLTVEARTNDPVDVSIRVVDYEGDADPVVNQTVPMELGDRRDYTDRLAADTTYLVVVETPNDRLEHVLRTYQSLTIVVTENATIERELDVE